MNGSALGGLRVLDFSHALAGPYCTLLLAEYGAEVYKLEARNGGDMGRGWGPPFIPGKGGGQAAFFYGLNRGKRGISIDLKQPEGIELCLRLAEKMDVLVENFRPGTMERLGLGYQAVSARNPRLIYCSISGYGQQGPARDEAAMDLIMQCASGLISMTGTEAGDLVRCGYSVADITAGLFAVIGILMAVHARERTGAGQYVDVSMLDSMISAMTSNFMTYLGSGIAPKPAGTAFPTIVPYRVYQARDRAFSIAIGSEKLWSALCAAIGRSDLENDARFATNPLRIGNREELEPLLETVFAERDVDDWLARLGAAGIPCSFVRNFDEVAADPQAAARDMFPVVGGHRVTGTPVKLSGTPGGPSTPAPALGQDTRRVLQALIGLDDTALDEMARAQIIFEPPSD